MLKFKVSAMTEPLNLSWEQFSDHLQLMSRELFKADKYSDVTIVCDDQIQFKAHKIILSACSPVFKNIIDNNPSKHPLIYLRGIQSQEMESILQFMYLGEGKFYYERMGEFIKVSKDLEVKEISNGVEIPNVEEDVTKETITDDKVKEPDEDYEHKPKPENLFSQSQPRNQISSTECPECGKDFSRKPFMLRHFRSVHKAIKYPCVHCDYQATRHDSLQDHIAAKHSDRTLKCDQCDFQTRWRQEYNRHKKTIHAMSVSSNN